jgi:hypothetical protein
MPVYEARYAATLNRVKQRPARKQPFVLRAGPASGKVALDHPPGEEAMGGLLKESIFGINILSAAGFLVMGFGLTLRRMARAGAPVCFGLMTAGTVLVLLGLYADRLLSF